MSFQRLNIKACVFGRKNDESYDCYITTTSFEVVVEPCKGLNENISTFIAKLIAASSEEEQSLVQIKVNVSMEMPMDKLHNLFFGHLVKILKLMADSLHIQTI